MSQLPTYAEQQEWRDIQSFLPERLHFTPDHSLTEEVWHHRGHALHLDRWRNPSAKVRLVMHHGVGTNGRMMSMILGVPLHRAGFELVAIDMPGYGCTVPKRGHVWDFAEWVDIAMPAGMNERVKGIVGMCFIDMRIQSVSDTARRNLFMSRIGAPMGRVMHALGLGWFSMPMSIASRMSALVNDPWALAACMRDKTSAAAWVSMSFLTSFTTYRPSKEPKDFDTCPILLTQPAEDRWVPLWVSELFLKDVDKVKVKTVVLEGAGHYPLEDPGLGQMAEAIVTFLKDIKQGT